MYRKSCSSAIVDAACLLLASDLRDQFCSQGVVGDRQPSSLSKPVHSESRLLIGSSSDASAADHPSVGPTCYTAGSSGTPDTVP